ncbi:hypothetical protein MMC18_007304 [Xylographa bjoerkii]|nr:hypothetical protein [Xylographa bjoerkii]
MATHPDATAPPPNLPLSTSPTLHLTHPTPAEKEATWRLNGAAWRGPLSLEAYIRREHHLASQPLTQNGGITYWILVDSAEATASADPQSPSPRTILASCETLRKRALVAHRATPSTVTAITAHGIGSVFCAPALRKRGYAGRMMAELGAVLAAHQQVAGQASLFNVLYSDIGKQFYARRGWHARESRHVALPAVRQGEEKGLGSGEGREARALYASDLGALCEADERLLRRRMGRWGEGGADTRVAFVPDVETMGWHHAREEFAAGEMQGRKPDVKGALVEAGEGRVWAVWTRTFGAGEEGSVLHVLRMVVEGEEDGERVEAAAKVLRAAQREAGRWGMKTVEVWNPERVVVEAARTILGEVEVVERDEESITSLMWYGEGKVEWVGNEKYGWC